jgi:hypothetical protein
MTIEHKFVMGLKDIKAITLKCLNPMGCETTFSGSPDSIKIPSNCPQCGHEWIPSALSGYLAAKAWPYANFVNSIKAIRANKHPENLPGFEILLEFKAEN